MNADNSRTETWVKLGLKWQKSLTKSEGEFQCQSLGKDNQMLKSTYRRLFKKMTCNSKWFGTCWISKTMMEKCWKEGWWRGKAQGEVIGLHKALQQRVRSFFMETIWTLHLSHTKHAVHMILHSVFYFPLPSIFFVLFFPFFASYHHSPFHHFTFSTSLLFLTQKISYSLMHGSCSEQCYFNFPWQRSLCFSRSDFSFGSNVLLCQRWTHSCVK